MAVKASASVTLSKTVDVSGVTRYYQLVASTASTPAKPTTNPPSSAWTSKEPGYDGTTTNTLYFTDMTVLSDGTFSFSDVSKSSSYEAAKQAYNKASTALSTANVASSKITQTASRVGITFNDSGTATTGTLINADSTGIEVGYSEDGSSFASTHTKMGTDAFSIHDKSHNELASFGADKMQFSDSDGDNLFALRAYNKATYLGSSNATHVGAELSSSSGDFQSVLGAYYMGGTNKDVPTPLDLGIGISRTNGVSNIYMNASNISSANGTMYSETLLYSSTTGTTETVTMYQSAASFTYLDIYYVHNNVGIHGTYNHPQEHVRVYSPDGTYTTLSAMYVATDTIAQLIIETIQVSGRYIYRKDDATWLNAAYTISEVSAGKNVGRAFRIVRVTGSK